MICQGSRILIVEDEYFSAYYLENALGREGYQVVGTVASGAEAVVAAARTSPDLVIMDISLSGPMDGLAAARKIREGSQAFILFLTGYQDAAHREEAGKIGRSAYVVKPAGLAEIHRVIRDTVI